MKRSRQAMNGMRRVDLSAIELAPSETARHINRGIVLQLVHSRQPISRVELARLSGLQPSTVSQTIDQRIQERWVREGAAARRPRGRRPTMLVMNDDLVVFAADIHPRQVAVAMVDLNGRLLSRSTLPLGYDPAKAVAVIFAPNLKWPKYDIKQAIEHGMGLPTEMENAAAACLMSELWFGRMDGVRDAVLITVSEGIGAGILANGQLISGQRGMAGEFGHISIDPSGPRCACKQNGCWEVFGSCNAALRYYSESEPKAKHLSFHELLNLAEEGNVHALTALAKQAKYIGKGLRMVTAALSPEIILIAGDITAAAWGPVFPHHPGGAKGGDTKWKATTPFANA